VSVAHGVVIVVTYNSGATIEMCLAALAETRYRSVDVLVVDNASRDESADLAESRGVEVVRSRVNLGFAGGVNEAIAYWERNHGGADVYALLNPDCIVTPGWFGPLLVTLVAQPSIAVVGGRLHEWGGGALQHAGARISANGITEHIGRGETDFSRYDRCADVDYVTGALFAFRRDTWRTHGPFDPAYFPAYFEEVDFCVRCRKDGGRVVYVPESAAIHAESHVMGRGSKAFLRAYHRGRMRFLVAHLLVRGRLWDVIRAEACWLLSRRALRDALPALIAYGRVPGLLLRKMRTRRAAAA
jgi:GT2 family glycosyltransferase